MQTRVRTTIILPEDLLQHVKMQAILEKTTLSGLIQNMIEKKKSVAKKGRLHMKLGKYSLGVKSSLSRKDIYADYFRHKIPR